MIALSLFETTFGPRSLVVDPPMTDAELEELCFRSDDVQIERTSDGVIRGNPPTGSFTGDGNADIIYQIRAWWLTHKRGRAYDSNTGFFLLDGSLMCPDTAYVLPEQLIGLTKAERTRMLRLCPAFVVELLSRSDSLAEARNKMGCWLRNGAQLGWLVDPYRRCVEVYVPGVEVQNVSGRFLRGSGPVQGFTMDLSQVWDCYED